MRMPEFLGTYHVLQPGEVNLNGDMFPVVEDMTPEQKAKIYNDPFWDKWEASALIHQHKQFRNEWLPPLKVCPGCGYGVTASGIVLVTQPDLVILSDDPRLCPTCGGARTGGRLSSDPQFFKHDAKH